MSDTNTIRPLLEGLVQTYGLEEIFNTLAEICMDNSAAVDGITKEECERALRGEVIRKPPNEHSMCWDVAADMCWHVASRVNKMVSDAGRK
jgi:hypothetical protein